MHQLIYVIKLNLWHECTLLSSHRISMMRKGGGGGQEPSPAAQSSGRDPVEVLAAYKQAQEAKEGPVVPWCGAAMQSCEHGLPDLQKASKVQTGGNIMRGLNNDQAGHAKAA